MNELILNPSWLIFLYVLVVIVSAFFAGACLEYRNQAIVKVYLTLMGLYILWVLANLFLILAPEFNEKQIFATLRLVFISLIPPCWVYFTRELFATPDDRKMSKLFFGFLIIPSALFIAGLSDSLSGYMFSEIKPLMAFGIPVLKWRPGILMKLHFIQSYSLLLVSTYYCVKGFQRYKGLKIRYGVFILFSLALYIFLELFGYLFSPEFRFLGFPSLAQVLSTVAFYYALHHQQVVRSFSQNNHVLFESLPMPVLLIDSKDQVVLFNSRARDDFSFKVSSVGQNAYDILPSDITQDLPPPSLIRPGHIVGTSIGLSSTQEKKYFEITSEPFNHRSLLGQGRILLFKEVTELKEMTQTNQRLMSLMSHDLLGNISSLEMLSRNKSVLHWDLIADNAKSAADLLKNLLLWSSTQGSFYQPHMETFSMMHQVGATVDSLVPVAESKNIQIEICDNGENILMNADKKMFAAILRNILSNSIRHAPVGSIVQVACIKTSDLISLSVRDQGPGIDSSIVKEILAYNGDKPLHRYSSSGGYGIGLFVINHFIKLHNGRLEISSNVGKGCTVTALFPAI